MDQAYAAGQLRFSAVLQSLRQPQAFHRYLAPLRAAEWVVYAQPPFGGPQHVVEYLSRYTHRVAISNRLLHMQNGQVSFRYKDYRHPQRPKLMTVSAQEFIRRFLLHALPSGFQRIRYYGFLSNCHVPTNWITAVSAWPSPAPISITVRSFGTGREASARATMRS